MASLKSQQLTEETQVQLLTTLKNRFEKNMHRHQGIKWSLIQKKLEENTMKTWSLNEMEQTGGEPDVVGFDLKTGEYLFYDCSAQSPSGRRSLCYDGNALESRKEHKPRGSAMGMAEEMGIELMTFVDYQELQKLGEFDTTTSSWIKTPDNIRKLGGSIFADLRYATVFSYHNGAESYYASRGFRGLLKV